MSGCLPQTASLCLPPPHPPRNAADLNFPVSQCDSPTLPLLADAHLWGTWGHGVTHTRQTHTLCATHDWAPITCFPLSLDFLQTSPRRAQEAAATRTSKQTIQKKVCRFTLRRCLLSSVIHPVFLCRVLKIILAGAKVVSDKQFGLGLGSPAGKHSAALHPAGGRTARAREKQWRRE